MIWIKISPKIPCDVGWTLSQGKDTGKKLDHEGSSFIKGLIHYLSPSLEGYSEVVEMLGCGWGPFGGSRRVRHVFEVWDTLSPILCLFLSLSLSLHFSLSFSLNSSIPFSLSPSFSFFQSLSFFPLSSSQCPLTKQLLSATSSHHDVLPSPSLRKTSAE